MLLLHGQEFSELKIPHHEENTKNSEKNYDRNGMCG